MSTRHCSNFDQPHRQHTAQEPQSTLGGKVIFNLPNARLTVPWNASGPMAGSKRAAAEDYFGDNVEKKVRITNDPEVAQKTPMSSVLSGPKATAARQSSFPMPQDRTNQVDNPYGRRESLDRGAAQRDKDRTSGHNSPAQLIIPRRGEPDKAGSGHGSGANSPSVSRNGSVVSNGHTLSPVKENSRTNGAEKTRSATLTPLVTDIPMGPRRASSGRSTPLSRSTTPQIPIAPMTPTNPPAQQSNQLATSLGEFTNLLMSMASTSTKREQAVNHLEQLQSEIVQGARFFAGFHSLSEQKNNAVARAQKRVNELNERMEQYGEAHKNLVTALATGVAAGTNTDNSATDAFHRSVVTKLQAKDAEILTLKTRLKGLEDNQNTLSGKTKEFATNHSSLEKQVDLMDRAFIRDRVRLDKIEKDLRQDQKEIEALQDGQRNRFEGLEDRINRRRDDHERLERRIADLSIDLSKLSSQVHDNTVAKPSADISKVKIEQNGLKRMVDEHHKILLGLKATASDLKQVLDRQEGMDKSMSDVVAVTKELKTTVLGDGDTELGVIGNMTVLRETVEKTADGLRKLETALRENESMIDGLRDRTQATRARSSSVTVVTHPATGEIVADIEAMRRDVEELKHSLGGIREEQDKKDEILAEENQELRSNMEALISGPAKEISELKQHLHALSENVSILQRRSSEAAHAQTQPAPAELISRFEAVSKQLHITTQRVDVQARVLQTLEERYNNITTDDLARRMVHQISMMYPEPARFQHAIDRTKVMDQQLRGRMGKIEAEYETSHASVNTALSMAKKADEKAGSALVKVDKLEETQRLTADEVRGLKDVYGYRGVMQEANHAAVDAKIGSISKEVAELSAKVDKVDVRAEELGKEVEEFREESHGTRGQILGAIDILADHNGLEPFEWLGQQDE